ncbi:MAG: FHA domain-containing protein [Planctomycetes bacterium]|nr:FHA domain-containing protein [Planctomycetota bacterium]
MPQVVERLVLKGIKGMAQGELHYINYGQIVTVGRSHTCDIAYTNFKNYRKYLSSKKKKPDPAKNVSRRHLRIALYNNHSIQLKDLSTNGTYLNGKLIRKVIIPDITEKSYEIRLGPTETFGLSAEPQRSPDRPPAGRAGSVGAEK